MVAYSFPPGIAFAVTTVGDQGAGIDTDTAFAINQTATVYANPQMTTVVPVRDFNGNPTTVRSGAGGLFPGFLADDVKSVWLRWSPTLPPTVHHSDQALSASEEALAAVAALRTELQQTLTNYWTKAQADFAYAPFNHDDLHRDLFYTKGEAAARFAPITMVSGQTSIGIDTDGVPYVIVPDGTTPTPTPPPPTPPATNTVTTALRDWLPLWRLQLPTDTDNNLVIDEIRVPQLSTYSSQFFSETPAKDGFQFWVPGSGFSSQNSQYARTELREVTATGANAAWDTRDGRRHTLKIPPMAVDSVTGNKRRLIIVQIHNGDDLVTLRMDVNPTGGLQVAFMYDDGLASKGFPPPVVVVPNYTLGTVMPGGELVVQDGVVKCYWNGALVASFTDNMNKGAACYFKIGAYFLSEPGITSYARAPEGTVITIPPEPADVSARVRMLGNPVVSHVTVQANTPEQPGGTPVPGIGPYGTLSRFKLQLPINSDNAGNIDEIPRDQLVAGYTSEFFRPTADGRGFRFRTPVTGARTSGSQFPRTELREMQADGITTAGWTPADGKNRAFKAVCRINHLPAADPQTTIFQIHNVDTEVVTFRCDGGAIRARKNGSSLNPYPIPSYTYGADFTYEVLVSGGPSSVVTMRINGAVAHTFPFSDLTVGPTGVFYFKAGNYLQANPTTVADANEYGEVELRDIVCTF